MSDKANDSSQVSGKAARGKRHTAKPSPETALAGGVSKPSLLGSILGRPVSTEEMLLRSEIARLQHLLRATTEALEAIVLNAGDSYVGMLYSELIGARAALAKVRGKSAESTSATADEGQ